MIWVKRFSPLVVAVVLWFGWSGYQSYVDSKRRVYDRKIATVTAHLWVASVKFRDQHEVYLAYRDSLLASWGTTAEEIELFPTRYGEEVKVYRRFAATLDSLVDSLKQLEDSIWRTDDTLVISESTGEIVDTLAVKRSDSIKAASAKPRTR